MNNKKVTKKQNNNVVDLPSDTKAKALHVFGCSYCEGPVDRFEHLFRCRQCGAIGDLITGIMTKTM